MIGFFNQTLCSAKDGVERMMNRLERNFLNNASAAKWISVDELERRGWTPSMISDFASKQNKRSINDNYFYRAEFVLSYEKRNKANLMVNARQCNQ